MTQHQSSPGAGNPVLQQLDFSKTYDDGYMAVFRAQVGNMDIPDAPVFALTVTVASPGGDDKASAELEAFLREMRARFELTAPSSDDGPSGDQNPELFNIDTDILIEPELVRAPTDSGNVDVAMTVQATVEGFTLAGGLIELFTGVLRGLGWLASRRFRTFYPPYPYYSVGNKICNQYKARNGVLTRGRVTCDTGDVMVCSLDPAVGQPYDVPYGHISPYLNARKIGVIGNARQSTYTISAGFRPFP
jgi:hypothetical protein